MESPAALDEALARALSEDEPTIVFIQSFTNALAALGALTDVSPDKALAAADAALARAVSTYAAAEDTYEGHRSRVELVGQLVCAIKVLHGLSQKKAVKP